MGCAGMCAGAILLGGVTRYVAKHYANISMLYSEIFTGLQDENLIFFLIFAKKHR